MKTLFVEAKNSLFTPVSYLITTRLFSFILFSWVCLSSVGGITFHYMDIVEKITFKWKISTLCNRVQMSMSFKLPQTSKHDVHKAKGSGSINLEQLEGE